MTDQSVPEPQDDANLIEVAAFLSNLYGTRRETIYKRLVAGWSPEKAAKTPVFSQTASIPTSAPARGSVSRKQLLEYKGERRTVSSWAARMHMSPGTLTARLNAGWSIKKALTQPLRTKKEAARRAANSRARKQSNKPKKMLFRRFGRLLVADQSTPDRHGNRRFECHCDCGNTVFLLGSNLRSRFTQSCGCIQRDKIRKRQAQEIEQMEQHISTLQWSEDPHAKKLLRGLIVRLRKWRAKVRVFEE
jgi:hypothetical protein